MEVEIELKGAGEDRKASRAEELNLRCGGVQQQT